MSALLEVRGLAKTFEVPGADGGREEVVAVAGVDFDVPANGSVALVGESGSGKSTTARIVAGLEVPSRGEVRVDEHLRDVSARGREARRARAREVQMVFQDPYHSLDPRQTLGSCIGEVLREHFDLDRAARTARATELLERVGLDGRQLGRRPAELSGGQRQRVAIARALAVEPSLLILDEAVSALDVSVQAQVLNLLADLRESLSTAFLFISHDLGVVRQVSDECLVMLEGRIVERGPTEGVLDSPQDPYTQRLLEAIPREGWQPRRASAIAAGAGGTAP